MSANKIQFQEKEEKRDEYLQQFRDALKSKNIGNGIPYEDKHLLKFLRCKNYNIDQSCEMIKCYVELFQKYPEFFENIEYSKLAFENGMFQVFPKRNVTGETLAALNPGKWEPSQFSFAQAMTTTIYGYEFAALDDAMQINGVIEICDCGEIGMRQFLKLGLSEIKLGAMMTEQAMPIKWHKIFVVFENYVLDMLYAVVKPFLSKELKERISFIGNDMTKLHEMVPPELLPPKYGGTLEYSPSEYYQFLKGNESIIMDYWKPFKEYKKE